MKVLVRRVSLVSSFECVSLASSFERISLASSFTSTLSFKHVSQTEGTCVGNHLNLTSNGSLLASMALLQCMAVMLMNFIPNILHYSVY